MTGRKKEILLEKMAVHVLQHGLNTASLRPLARAAGTSDRMLIYHFKTKEKLVEDLLSYLAGSLEDSLITALPAGRAPSRRACLEEILDLMRSPDTRGFLRIWFDILSAAQNGNAAHRMAGGEIISGFHQWLESRLPDGEVEPGKTAAALLAVIEGILVMDAVERRDLADAAVELLTSE